MPTCVRCNTSLSAGTRFCPQCGFQFDRPVPNAADAVEKPVPTSSETPTTPTPQVRRKSPGLIIFLVILAIIFWPITAAYLIGLGIKKLWERPERPQWSAKLKSNLPVVAKGVWWTFLIFLSLAAFVLGARGDIWGFIALGILGLPSIWLMLRGKTMTKILITLVWLVSITSFGIYSLTPAGKAAYAKVEQDVKTQELLEAKNRAVEAKAAMHTKHQEEAIERKHAELAAKEQAAQQAQSDEDAAAKSEQDAEDSPLDHLGDIGVLRMANGKQGDTIYIGTTIDAWNKIMDAAQAKDDVGLNQLLMDGSAIAVPEGTHAKFLGISGFTLTHIRITDGSHAGEDGWIPDEWLKKG